MMVTMTSRRLFSTLAVLLIGTVVMPNGFAQAFDRGQALYENHCMSCHESWAHVREGRSAATFADLRRRVEAWSVHSNLGWSDEDVDDVSHYLNKKFYQMKQ